MKIRLSMHSGEATGEIVDSVTGRDFISLLPLTLTMYDLFGREKPGHCLVSSPEPSRAS